MVEKQRIDIEITERGLAESREKAKVFIMAGDVYVNNQKCDKPGTLVSKDDNIEVRGEKLPFVSRGGLKLDKAVHTFNIDLKDKICVDIGASTGGFTDCMLQNGAKKVYAVDVGYGQLAWSLRTDERVVNIERQNFRYITEEHIPEKLDFASADVAFISLKKIIPPLLPLLKDDAKGVFLIKPQFEAGKENVGKNGVVRDANVHYQVIKDITDFLLDTGFSIIGLDYSPITGPKGNIEYLVYVRYDKQGADEAKVDIANLVEISHSGLSK